MHLNCKIKRKVLASRVAGIGLAGICAALFLCGMPTDNPRASAAALPDDPPEAKALPIPFPDGVIDAERRTAFVTSPKGGVQAIRLEDGKVLWTNDACAGQPWLVAGQRLIVRGDGIIVLDLKNDGKVLQKCDAPAYPKVKVPERCTVSFHLWDPQVIGDNLEAKWYGVANIDRSKGRPFAFEAWTGFNKAAPVGTAKFNLDSGKTALEANPKPADVTGSLIPEAAKPEKRMPAGLPEKLAAVWQEYHRDQNGRITVEGKRLVGVSMTLEKAGQEFLKKVAVNSWDLKTGAAAEPVELIKDKAIDIANIVLTEDRRHAGVVMSTSMLTVYSLADGKLVAREIKGVSSPETAFVDGKRLYFAQLTGSGAKETPNVLKALDLSNGKILWERQLKPRSTIPLPPG